jgi:hypothetical protein
MQRIPFTEAEITNLRKRYPDTDVEGIYWNFFQPWLATKEGDPELNLYAKFSFFIERQLAAYADPPDRIELAVPFTDRAEVKRLGAQYDWVKKVWFIPTSADMKIFRRWLPSSPEPDKYLDEIGQRMTVLEAEIAALKQSVAFLSRQLDVTDLCKKTKGS